MTKIITLKKRKDFLRVAQGFHVATHNMVLQATQSLSCSSDIYVGYTSTKRIGNAVIRNKSRRRLRAIVREVLAKHAAPQTDYVFIARSTTATCCFKELRRDVIYALKRINKNFISPQITDTGNESSVTGKKTVYTQNSSPDTAQNDIAVTDTANPMDRPQI